MAVACELNGSDIVLLHAFRAGFPVIWLLTQALTNMSAAVPQSTGLLTTHRTGQR